MLSEHKLNKNQTKCSKTGISRELSIDYLTQTCLDWVWTLFSFFTNDAQVCTSLVMFQVISVNNIV